MHDIIKVPNQITSTKLMLSICNNPRFHEGIPDVLDKSVIAPPRCTCGGSSTTSESQVKSSMQIILSLTVSLSSDPLKEQRMP